MSRLMEATEAVEALPGAELDAAKMPGHWLLARLGKRVLRPGGRELTEQMLNGLHVESDDSVVELAPGLGITARKVLANRPYSYTGVERDASAATQLGRFLASQTDSRCECICGHAEATGLPSAFASVVYGEAMLTMQTQSQKSRIVREARRVLKPHGRYGIHELLLTPDDLDEGTKAEIQRELSSAIHVGARPLTIGEWRELLEAEGFQVRVESTAPMHLLRAQRLLRDEGLGRTLRFVANVLRDAVARRRVLEMRRVFKRYEHHLAAIAIVAERAD